MINLLYLLFLLIINVLDIIWLFTDCKKDNYLLYSTFLMIKLTVLNVNTHYYAINIEKDV